MNLFSKAPTAQCAVQILFFSLVIKPVMTLFFGIRVSGQENLQINKPFIIVANHSSHLDAMVLLHLCPLHKLHKIRPVAAEDYFLRNKYIAWIACNIFNILPISRKNITKENNPLPKLLNALHAGESLIIFPEGTRGAHRDDLGNFLSGVSHIIKHYPGLHVIPIYLHNLGRCLPKGEWIPVPYFCDVTIGQPFVPQGTKHDIMTSIRNAIADLRT